MVKAKLQVASRDLIFIHMHAHTRQAAKIIQNVKTSYYTYCVA